MKSTKKILSLALTLAMLLSAVFCTGAVATAEGTTPTAFSYKAVTHSDPAAKVELSSLGQNLIPDSTVAEFDKEGNYKAYYGTTEGAVDRTKVVNANAWWASTHNRLAYESWFAMQGPGVSNRVSNTVTHTDDNSGSIAHDYAATSHNSTFLNMSLTETNSYYLLSFWVKSTVGSSLTYKFINGYQELDAQNSFSTTTEWQQKMFIVSVADKKWESFMVYSAENAIQFYIDDIELYELDGAYAEECIAANKLLNGVTDSDSRAVKAKYTLGSYAEFDFSVFGKNLASDPTVSKFNDGVYDTTNGIKKGTGSGDIFSTTDSHTDDGSGVVNCSGTGHYILTIGPQLQAKSYYVITFFAKTAAWTTNTIKHCFNASGWQSVDSVSTGNPNWKRITYIVYTGNAQQDAALYFYNSVGMYVDDFGVYKLDPKHAVDCINAGALSVPETEGTAALTQSINLFKIDSKTDFEQFGPNLFPDANVSAFDADGVYKDYSADNNAWWSKDSNNLKAKDSITKDITRTADGSGALTIPANASRNFTVPTMEANSYYVLSTWAYDAANGPYIQSTIGNGTQQNFSGEVGKKTWTRVVYLIRTGDKALNVNWNFYASRQMYFDDFELRKIDDTVYAEECIAAGKFTNTNVAAATEAVATTAANQMINLPEKEGYFIPQGSVLDASGAYAEKLGNGRYFVANAGDVSYTYFRYPAGNVGTFGVSKKAGDDTAENEADKSGIQFGSILTDNLSADASGTLVLRGDFDAFRKSLPNYSREQIIKIIYNNLQRGNVAAGDVATIANGDVKIDAMYVPRNTYMWKNSANTELQYAVRVFGVATNRGDVTYTAVGYAVNDGVVEFSKEIKSATYNGLN